MFTNVVSRKLALIMNINNIFGYFQIDFGGIFQI